MIYVHITEDCQKDAQVHSLIPELENFAKKIKDSQNLSELRDFRPTSFWKKGFGRSFRLLAYGYSKGSDLIVFMLRLFPRSDGDYQYFIDNYQDNRAETERRFFKLTQAEVESIFEDLQIRTEIIPPVYISEEESGWLYNVFDGRSEKNNDDCLILESRDWVESMLADSMHPYLALYNNFLQERLDISNLPPSISNTDIKHIYDSGQEGRRVGIIYLYRPDYSQMLLLAPIQEEDEQFLQRKKAKFISEISRVEDVEEDGKLTLLRVASRSYPFFMVLDRESWLKIQNDEEANLALSPEEGDLLESIRKINSSNDNCYPLFINGRAGSGKSTMLQYLAADYIDFALSYEANIFPLYMTYSSDLLSAARLTVKGLLSSQFTRLLQNEVTLEDNKEKSIDKLLSKSFVVFHEYLYGLLSSEQKISFPPGKFVGYPEFCRLWEQDFSRRSESRKFSVDLAWHVIRSYIKGSRSDKDDDLSPEEFSCLPKKRRSITVARYKEIYQEVWIRWYKRLCDEENFWDDQDLVVTILNSNIVNSLNYSSIFCDESQDFTPIELEFILQLSIFSKRALQPEELKRVPFIFAGDPLQTLNPTGFRWETIQADFYERFSSTLDSRRTTGRPTDLSINYKELKFNYRSNPGIVKFCNLIQAIRTALIGGELIQPQEAWCVHQNVPVIWADVNDLAIQQELKTDSSIVKIINCEIGAESEFVDSDSILKGVAQTEEGVYQNIISPMRAKGLEFSRVVLYKFGDSAPNNFKHLLKGEINIFDNPELRLSYEYFFNRLYVAASRAKSQLIIVDSREAIESFWKFAIDESFFSEIINRCSTNVSLNFWDDKIAYLMESSGSLADGTINVQQLATDYERQGDSNSDPYLLRQAALSYTNLGNRAAAVKCKARALSLEGKWEDAGNLYEENGLKNDAFECYWKGKYFIKITELCKVYAPLASRLESRLSDLMVRPGQISEHLLNLISSRISEDRNGHILSDSTWCHVLVKTLDRLAQPGQQGEGTNWNIAYSIFDRLRGQGLSVPGVALAKIAYNAGHLEIASKILEECGQTTGELYFTTKANSTRFPQNISWFGRLGKLREIVENLDKYLIEGGKIDENIAPMLDHSAWVKVTDLAIKMEKYYVALQILKNTLERLQLNKLMASLLVDKSQADVRLLP
jgi:hypothetical protein